MKRFDRVSCAYTGGGIYVYSALFNGEVWLYGALDEYFGSFDRPYEHMVDGCYEADPDARWKRASVPYPTWGEILQSIQDNCDRYVYNDITETYHFYYNDLTKPCMEYPEDEPSSDGLIIPPSKPDENTKRMESLALIIETFEDFLDQRGIEIPNEDKDRAIADGEDPESISNIYGCDYGDLSDALEDVLRRLGMMK